MQRQAGVTTTFISQQSTYVVTWHCVLRLLNEGRDALSISPSHNLAHDLSFLSFPLMYCAILICRSKQAPFRRVSTIPPSPASACLPVHLPSGCSLFRFSLYEYNDHDPPAFGFGWMNISCRGKEEGGQGSDWRLPIFKYAPVVSIGISPITQPGRDFSYVPLRAKKKIPPTKKSVVLRHGNFYQVKTMHKQKSKIQDPSRPPPKALLTHKQASSIWQYWRTMDQCHINELLRDDLGFAVSDFRMQLLREDTQHCKSEEVDIVKFFVCQEKLEAELAEANKKLDAATPGSDEYKAAAKEKRAVANKIHQFNRAHYNKPVLVSVLTRLFTLIKFHYLK